jgi:peptidyl-prolyl cis-trans isomerase A (cyclophilin A)
MKRHLILLLGPVVAVAAACGEKPAPSSAGKAVPDSLRVTFETSRGTFAVECVRAWAPNGVARFYDLVQQHFYDQTRFFRVIPGFVAQFGLSADPKNNAAWDGTIPDDSVRQSNTHGTLSFASKGPNTRTHQLFINLADNKQLDGMGFAPICRVVDGLSVVDSLYSGYGESPDQIALERTGNAYLDREFPKLDYIKTARITGSR